VRLTGVFGISSTCLSKEGISAKKNHENQMIQKRRKYHIGCILPITGTYQVHIVVLEREYQSVITRTCLAR
jgi:hypothetical protein